MNDGQLLKGLGSFDIFTATPVTPGNDIAWTVPSDVIVQVLGVRLQIVTDATAVSRVMFLEMVRGTTTFMTTVAPGSVTAASTVICSWYNGSILTPYTGQASREGGLPGQLILNPADVIKTAVANLQAGDALSSMTVMGVVSIRP